MNFLAHFFLSPPTPELIVGSYLGDFIKGKQYQDYEPVIGRGILLHREVDRYTDTHPVFRQSKRRLSQQHGHYAGVVADILYDHLLAIHWSRYSDVPLPQFAQQVYAILQQHITLMPTPAQQIVSYMRAYDWLSNYAHREGVVRALLGMQQRARFSNKMGQALQDFIDHEREYTYEFYNFLPQIQYHIDHFSEHIP